MLKLADIIEALTNIRPEKAIAAIPHAVIDSRQAQAGSLFIALLGENVDGHDFVGDAFSRGAAFALVQKDLSADFNQIDLREKPAQLNEDGWDAPLCILVNDSLFASVFL